MRAVRCSMATPIHKDGCEAAPKFEHDKRGDRSAVVACSVEIRPSLSAARPRAEGHQSQLVPATEVSGLDGWVIAQFGCITVHRDATVLKHVAIVRDL